MRRGTLTTQKLENKMIGYIGVVSLYKFITYGFVQDKQNVQMGGYDCKYETFLIMSFLCKPTFIFRVSICMVSWGSVICTKSFQYPVQFKMLNTVL